MKDANFAVGQIVQHRRFNYRGVIFDVDPNFMGSEVWYEAMAKSRPPKEEPWYHVLVHNATHQTYVAERNLARDDSGFPITHPNIEVVFSNFNGINYVLRIPSN